MIWHILYALLAAIGAGVVTFIVGVFLADVVRSVRQSARLATGYARMSGHRNKTLRGWWAAFRYDWSSTYSYVEFGPWRFPKSPSEKIRRRWLRG